MSPIEAQTTWHAADQAPPEKKPGRDMYLLLISLLKPKPKPEKPKD